MDADPQVVDNIDWGVLLGKHDPIWPLGPGRPVEKCVDVRDYDLHPHHCGGADAAAAEDLQPQCSSVGSVDCVGDNTPHTTPGSDEHSFPEESDASVRTARS